MLTWGGMDFQSGYTIIGFILAVTLIDLGLMGWLKRRQKTPSDAEAVYLWGNYSPLLTWLRRLPHLTANLFHFLSHPVQWREKYVSLRSRISKRIIRISQILETYQNRTHFFRPLLVISSFIFGIIGQALLIFFHKLEPGLGFLILAGLLWLAACPLLKTSESGVDLRADLETGHRPFLIKRQDARIFGIIFSIQLSILAVVLYFDRVVNESLWDIFGLWVASFLLYLLAFWPVPGKPTWLGSLRANWKKLLPFAIIILVAGGLRFYQLGYIPQIMENDEGIVGMQTLAVLTGQRQNMFEVFGGYGTLYFFLLALPVKWFGQNLFAIRLLTALIGTLTIPLAAWLGYRMFGLKTALIGSILLATSHLHIHFSRVSPTASSYDPLFSSVLVLLLYEGLTTRRPHWWVAAGVVMGLGMYFYVGARVLMLLCLSILILVFLFQRKLIRENIIGLMIMIGGFLVSAAPMLSWAFRHPDVFNARANQVGIIQTGWLTAEMARQGKPVWEILAQQIGNALLIFNYHPAAWFYQASVPMLGMMGGLLLWFGLIFSLTRLRTLPFLAISAWFWVTLAAGQVMIIDPPPNAYRTIGLLPAVCLMATTALLLLAETATRMFQKHGQKLAAGFITVVLLFEAGWNVWYYFGVWAGQFRYGDENTRRASLIGSYLGGLPSETQVFIAGGPAFRAKGWAALSYLKGETQYSELIAPPGESLPPVNDDQKTVLVVPSQMQADLERLKTLYPGGSLSPHLLGGQLYFWDYELNGE